MGTRNISEAPGVFKFEAIYDGDRIRARICEFDKGITSTLKVNEDNISQCFIENCETTVQILYGREGQEVGRTYSHHEYPRPLKIPKKKQKEIDENFSIQGIKTLDAMRENMKSKVRTAIKEYKIVPRSMPYKG